MDPLDYRLGFVCARRSQALENQQRFSNWNRILTDHHKFFVHPQANVRTLTDVAGRTVVVIGDIFVAHGTRQLDELLLLLASGDRVVTDDISGRFAVFVLDGLSATVLNDPLGSQSVFYTLGSDSIVSSHASLLAAVVGRRRASSLVNYMQSEGYRARNTRFMPGDLTLYDGIVHLVPNNELRMDTGMTSRYWPRQAVEPETFEGLLEVWTDYFRNYSRLLQATYEPVVGLTGGLDSRTVIATLRSFGVQPRYVTWDMGSDEAARIPGLVSHLDARHDWIELSASKVGQEYEPMRDIAREATHYTRGRPVLPSLMAELAGTRDVFVKGLGGEVMRGPWNSGQLSWLPEGPEKMMYRLYAGKAVPAHDEAYQSTTMEAIRGFISRANYSENLHGCDVGDLVYWEQRMGNWTSVQHAEMAVAMQSHSAMNSRRMFQAAWGLPEAERFSPDLLPRIMRLFDPELERL